MERTAWALIGAIVVIAGVATLWVYFVESAPDTRLSFETVSGEVLRNDGEEVHRAVPGMEIGAGDRVVTAPGARAELTLGAETRMRLRPSTTVQIHDVDEEGVHVELEGGSLRAVVRPDSPALRVSNQHREVVGTDAIFDIGVQEDGEVTLQAIAGALSVVGVPDVHRVSEGNRLKVYGDGNTVTTGIPEELLLAVDWPGETRSEVARVAGETEPGAEVVIEANESVSRVRADADGRFTIDIILDEGSNAVSVQARDVFGNEMSTRGTVERDTTAPSLRVDIDYER